MKWKRGFRCSIWWPTRWGSQLSSSRLGRSLVVSVRTADVLSFLKGQAGSRVYKKHAPAFMRTLAKHGELWRTLANPERQNHENLPDVNQSSNEGPPHSPEFRWRCPLYEGGLQNVPKTGSFHHFILLFFSFPFFTFFLENRHLRPPNRHLRPQNLSGTKTLRFIKR